MTVDRRQIGRALLYVSNALTLAAVIGVLTVAILAVAGLL